MLGMAFGAMGNVGARRQRGTNVSLMGTGRTRVMGRGGIFMEGEAKTIRERALDRQMAGLGGAGGKGPERLKVEQDMARGIREGAGHGAESAKHLRDLAGEGLKRGSLYTDDEKAHTLLSAMIDRLDVIAEVLGPVASAAAGAGATATILPDLAMDAATAAANRDLAKPATKGEENLMRQALGKKTPQQIANERRALAFETANVPVTPDRTVEASQRDIERQGIDRLQTGAAGMSAAPGFAGVAGAAGGGGGGAETGAPALKFVGELTVHFDSTLFRQQVVTIVGEAINSAEVRRALERGGVVYR
jgi:hypothetical protein